MSLADVTERLVDLARDAVPAPEAALLAQVLERYYRDVDEQDLAARSEADLFGAARAHLELARQRPPGTAKVRVYNPEAEADGWSSPHTVVDVVSEDMPFLVDSLSTALAAHGAGIQLVVHPLMAAERDREGRLLALDEGPPTEAWVHFEVDRRAQQEIRDFLAAALEATLRDIRVAVEDWAAMQGRCVGLAAEVLAARVPLPPEEIAVTAEFLRWMAEDNFVFLGYRDYELAEEGGAEVLRALPGTGLGILRDSVRAPRSQPLSAMAPAARTRVHDRHLLVLTKANSRSTVHRSDYFEYVGVKRFDATGRVVGEHRFLGLYTASAYRAEAGHIPFLRDKVDAVVARSGFPPDSHSGRALLHVLETYPRDELFQIGTDELSGIAMGIVNLQERKQVRLFARRDDYGRFVSCLVYVPRDRYSTSVVARIEQVLLAAYGGTSTETDTYISQSVLARVHVLVYVGPDAPRDVDTEAVERQLAAVVRWWEDDFRAALSDELGESAAASLAVRYAHAFPAAYREAYSPHAAVADLQRIASLDPADDPLTALYEPDGGDVGGALRFKLYSRSVLSLSSVLPLLEQLGVRVTDERPYHIRPDGGPDVWLYDFGLEYAGGAALPVEVREELRATFASLWRGEIENDGFNRLVLNAALTSRQITVLRAYARYLRQIGITFSQAYLEETLNQHPDVARQLVELFAIRLDPAFDANRTLEAEVVAGEIRAALDHVASLDEDRILRSFLGLVLATTRTNHYRTTESGHGLAVLSLKFDPSQIPDLPLPRPMFEIWVYAPHVEGVHLRGGRVARGGIRWSDRREDFRTEVLGLMKAQTVKNAVIVPVGAKGGFVVKRPPAGPEALRDEVARCYRAFIAALLDLTDNIVDGVVVAPHGVVRHDRDDPYLVVAADKGTATFSDLANQIALEYGYWLGDAFASGGSTGYDHKEMGITARGAWESVRRHFRSLGIDADTAPISVVGIGDMSGDVFGNGMLLSKHLRLLAAFDHRHIFLDPDPADSDAAYAERARLYELPRSSWADYDTSLISPGGGVWPRTAKSVPLSPQVRACLGVDATALTPADLISAILRAPVDLLWNGGIGTYVKASTETNAEVGDRANDVLRVNGADLRCRVVAEGGNLGLTQRGRIEYALNGGLVNTDAIDNSAGVDCSDHEVNLKILLDMVVRSGGLSVDERNALLASMTDEVAELCLEDNYAQNLALAAARLQAAPMLHVHGRYLHALEHDAHLDRPIEFLPTDKQLAERHAAGAGLTVPELAVVLAYTKAWLTHDVLASALPDSPYLQAELVAYFPRAVRERFADRVGAHPLHREILTTRVVNNVVNKAGTSFAFRMVEETGADVADIVRAHLAVQEVLAIDRRWQAVEDLDGQVPGPTQINLFLALRRMVERGALWLLRHRRPPLDIAATLAAFRTDVEALAEALPALVGGSMGEVMAAEAQALVGEGVPANLAAQASAWPLMHTSFDIAEVARARGRSVQDAAAVYWGLFDRLDLAWLWERVADLPRADRWQSHARGALRDDLAAELRAVTDEVLRAGDVFTAPADAIARWAAANERSLARLAKVFTEIRAGGVFDLTTVSVALRQLRNLVLSTGPLL